MQSILALANSAQNVPALFINNYFINLILKKLFYYKKTVKIMLNWIYYIILNNNTLFIK